MKGSRFQFLRVVAAMPAVLPLEKAAALFRAECGKGVPSVPFAEAEVRP